VREVHRDGARREELPADKTGGWRKCGKGNNQNEIWAEATLFAYHLDIIDGGGGCGSDRESSAEGFFAGSNGK